MVEVEIDTSDTQPHRDNQCLYEICCNENCALFTIYFCAELWITPFFIAEILNVMSFPNN